MKECRLPHDLEQWLSTWRSRPPPGVARTGLNSRKSRILQYKNVLFFHPVFFSVFFTFDILFILFPFRPPKIIQINQGKEIKCTTVLQHGLCSLANNISQFLYCTVDRACTQQGCEMLIYNLAAVCEIVTTCIFLISMY